MLSEKWERGQWNTEKILISYNEKIIEYKLMKGNNSNQCTDITGCAKSEK